ncbi:hypothetical protein [Paenibacillus hexagrammi]|uniref:Uncharacterized protein n=1 Tax=Paenibacillus hexagrammi TaxID=2908839 RepID=A0ABY3SH55_9BACL|nr:hypothetical protein [Paenibacillus sp. YPD9-1]UJF32277.1 hypothetical protein L0M14_21525 [Paenibacillus sp. YPD9-1]
MALTSAALPTAEELYLIRESVLLPFLLTIIDKNVGELQSSLETPLKSLYLAAADRLVADIHKDLVRINRTLRSQNIKIWREEHNENQKDELHYKYRCRGYTHELEVLRQTAKAELRVRLTLYVRQLSKELKKEIH